MMFTPAGFSQAQKFLLTQARPLERARYRFHFENAPAAEFRNELATFQNADGGFGRALEPDFRLPASSAIATAMGFQYLREAGVSARDPMVLAAVLQKGPTLLAQSALPAAPESLLVPFPALVVLM